MTTALAPRASRSLALRLAVSAVAAAALNALVALVAAGADRGGIGMGLQPVAYLPASVVGVLVGAAGWTLIARRAPRALPVVVPLALVLSWVPDVLLLGAGATVANVAGLMTMHLVVAGAAIAACRGARRDARA